MAEATAKIEATVTLILSLEEAAAVASVTGEVTGSAENSPRGYTSSVYLSLIKIPEVDQLRLKYDDLLKPDTTIGYRNQEESK